MIITNERKSTLEQVIDTILQTETELKKDLQANKVSDLGKQVEYSQVFKSFADKAQKCLSEIDTSEKAVNLILSYHKKPELKKISRSMIKKKAEEVKKELPKKKFGEFTDDEKKQIEKEFKNMLSENETLKMMFADADMSPNKKFIMTKRFKSGGEEMAMFVAFAEEHDLKQFLEEDKPVEKKDEEIYETITIEGEEEKEFLLAQNGTIFEKASMDLYAELTND